MSGKKAKRESILAAVEAGASNMSQLVRALGYSSVCGATTRKIRALVPEIAEKMKAPRERTKPETVSVKASKPKTVAKAKTSKREPRTEYARVEHNPFREGSAYATGYDVLAAASDKGIERSKWIDELARLMPKKKDESAENHRRRAMFNVTVLASSRRDGRSHRAIHRAAMGFFVDRSDGGWLVLRRRP